MGAKTIVDQGFAGIIADVECHLNQGLPSTTIVGFASKAVDESRERIRSAFTASGVKWPKKRLVINLAPADIPKENASFDLAMAVTVLEATDIIPVIDNHTVFFGELALDGSLRPVRGITGKLLAAQKLGLTRAVIPLANASQARLLDDIDVYALGSLADVINHLSGKSPNTKLAASDLNPATTTPDYGINLEDVVGQAQGKRAVVLATAGRHNILMNGPPGTGKTMLARSMLSILPHMTRQAIIETTHLHSLVDSQYDRIITSPPFQAPHHSSSDVAIVGGGQHLKPGAISLAHNGVLFLDELPEFRRNAIEALRQPLEDKSITLSRSKNSVTLPADFILVATANPCPCGYFGTHKECTCSMAQLQNYRRKLSGPIMDRIDIHVNVANVEHERLLSKNGGGITGQQARTQIDRALHRQHNRYGSVRYNSDLSSQEVKQLIELPQAAKELLNKGARQLQLSPRAYIRTIKLARTVADVEDQDEIDPKHIAEALQYRPISSK